MQIEDLRQPTIAPNLELSTGHQDKGPPKKKYKDSLNKYFSACHIYHHKWLTIVAKCNIWQHTTDHTICYFKPSCTARQMIMKQLRRNQTTPTSVGQCHGTFLWCLPMGPLTRSLLICSAPRLMPWMGHFLPSQHLRQMF